MIRRWVMAAGLLLPAAWIPALRAQERSVPATVVEIAGTNLYVNVGVTAGLTAGDTMLVRRAAAAPPVGALVVVAASAERALLTFAGRPFPVTRGDQLLLSVAGPAPAAAPPSVPAPVPPRPGVAPRAGPTQPNLGPRGPAAARETPFQMRGSATLEVYGSNYTTVGQGVDPATVNQMYAVPSLRLQSSMWNLPGGGRFSVNLRLTQQTGSAALFQRSSVVRIFDAHYDQELPALRVLAGRFFSPYEPFSGSWDGVLVRVGRAQGLGAGVEAGFMPSLGDETFTTDVPKYAAFAGYSHRGGALRMDEDVSVHAWRPTQGATPRTFVGWSQRLGVRGVRLDHRVEVDHLADGSWDLSRLDARLGVPLGSRMEVSAEYFRDHLNWTEIPLDSLTAKIDSLTSPRERLTTGGSYQLGMAFLSADLTLLLSGNDVRGQTYSGSLRLPEFAHRVAFGGMISYWTVETGTGVVIGPALDIRMGRMRSRAGYQYFQSSFNGVSTATHGADLSVTAPWGRRLESVFGINLRYGSNLKSQNAYSSFRLTF